MDWKLGGIVAICLLTPGLAEASDWVVTKDVDQMTDKVTCSISSDRANVTFYRYGDDRPNVSVASAYRDPYLTIRVDDNAAINMGNNAYDRQAALSELLPQLEVGKRIRVRYRDYPNWHSGDGEIGDLPQLLEQCVER